ncbi:hypothetical protein ACH4Y0_02650 [Streptomyces sp. NPDC020707]|uniref:hypothetical protein n=1 Tax=Streptomyces sp. NPDC020707 TaxID=3365084 RepID=UPI0037889FB9
MIAKTESQTRTPYDAEHITIVDLGRTMWALYIPDPEQAKNPRAVAENITAPEYANVEVVATATRCYKTEGAMASGWFISSGTDYGSEGHPNKSSMREALRLTISSYFTTEQEADEVTGTAPRYVVNRLDNGHFAVHDTVTTLDVATRTSRYAANDKAARLEEESGGSVDRMDAVVRAAAGVSGPNTDPLPKRWPNITVDGADERPKCGHGFSLKCGVTSQVTCEFGHEYGVFGDEGPVDRADCAVQAANDAAFYTAEDDGDTEFVVKVICPDHPEQAKETCEKCSTENEEGGEGQDTDDAFRQSFREVSRPSVSGRPTYERFV